MTTRLGIDDVRPLISAGSVASKAVVGEVIPVTALVWREGHDAVSATLSAWAARTAATSSVTMHVDPDDQDRVHGVFTPGTQGTWYFRVDAWSDPIATWKNAVTKKMAAGQSAAELANDLQHGAELFSRAALQTPSDVVEPLFAAARDLEDESLDVDKRVQVALSEEVAGILHSHPLRDLLVEGAIHEVYVERRAALYNSWYELFPRSTGGWDKEGNPVHGTFDTTAKALERVADMGFDTVYFPPIHPIGKVHRKGKNNSVVAEPGDVGSPWAIQDHSTAHPDLGTMEDFQKLVSRAQELGLEVALDFALQASPDHPWASSHPEFFTVLPDGSIAYAENPPKKYQDIYPLNFDNAPDAIYHEIYETLMIWVEAGVSTFRVDNPHTKPANFWNWLITRVHATHPDVIFLAEAFTRAPRLFGLAKAGFSQSYTYFTWQTSKQELTQFGRMHVEQADICRPNLFVNTPDILHESLQTGGRAMFAIRAVLAATMSPLWGVYSGFELYEHTPVAPGSEEYLDSEKYELRPRDFASAAASEDSLESYIRLLNQIRRDNPALQQLRTLRFHDTDNEAIIAYSKADPASGNVVLVVVNLDPRNAQEATVTVDMQAIGRHPGESYTVRDTITGSAYHWSERNFVRLEPHRDVAHVFVLPPADHALQEQLTWREVTDYRP
ncbi:MAG: maltotransferase domain-containing protein [Corynebacterium sp.]|uniref:maltotransferase domain-containing protein n=1 Tax=unclassified Corynebacterium TaxID=2624378 RepID=UPI00257B2A24|nr:MULTISPECIES: maltotransferase domain-containing protein [unclassified Corynebacterium]MDU1462128.1 maltotransferase domain-containing protein [Corynebacterium sp.]